MAEEGVGTLLHDVLTSRVYAGAREPPLETAPRLSKRLSAEVLLKREDLQPVFSFKLRGAHNKIAQLGEAERARGVITASAGTPAQGVAFSARPLGLRAVIVMPVPTPEIKVEAVRAMGAEVVLAGDSYSEAQARCDALAAESGLAFVHPFDDPLVIAGQGTIGEEILRQSHGRLDAVFVPVGGGGLVAGVGGYLKALMPAVQVVGVEPFEADAMHRSLQAGGRGGPRGGGGGGVRGVLGGDGAARGDRVQLPALRPRVRAHLRGPADRLARGRPRGGRGPARSRLPGARPDRQRDGQAARPLHGGRARHGARRAALPLRVPGAAGGAHAVPRH